MKGLIEVEPVGQRIAASFIEKSTKYIINSNAFFTFNLQSVPSQTMYFTGLNVDVFFHVNAIDLFDGSN